MAPCSSPDHNDQFMAFLLLSSIEADSCCLPHRCGLLRFTVWNPLARPHTAQTKGAEEAPRTFPPGSHDHSGNVAEQVDDTIEGNAFPR